MNTYKKFVSILFLSELGSASYFIAITWLLYAETANVLYTGLFVSLGFIPSFFSNLYFGVLVDRLNRKKLLIISLLIMATVITFFLICYQLNLEHLPILMIATHIVIQLCGSLFRPASQAFLTNLFPSDQLMMIFSKTSSYSVIGGILGSSCSGLILSVWGPKVVLTYTIIILLVGILLLLRIPYQDNKGISKVRSSIVKSIVEGFQYSFSQKFFVYLLCIMAIGQLSYHSTIGFLAVYTVDIVNGDAKVYGILQVVISIGAVVAGFYGARWAKRWHKSFHTMAMSILIAGLIVISLTDHFLLSCIGLFAIGASTTWVRTLLQAVQQMATKEDFHGRMASIRMFFNQGAVVILTPILGVLAQYFTVQLIYLVLLLIACFGFIICILLSKNKTFLEYVLISDTD